jgi:hypothetical protein
MGMHDDENNPMKEAHPVHYDCALRLSLSLEPCAGSRRLSQCAGGLVGPAPLARRGGVGHRLQFAQGVGVAHGVRDLSAGGSSASGWAAVTGSKTLLVSIPESDELVVRLACSAASLWVMHMTVVTSA